MARISSRLGLVDKSELSVPRGAAPMGSLYVVTREDLNDAPGRLQKLILDRES